MLARLPFAVAVSMAIIATPAADASPITYDFAATLSGAINGSNQVTGSFTINGNPTLNEYGDVLERGADVAVSVNLGGQTINFGGAPHSQSDAVFSGGIRYPIQPLASSAPGHFPGDPSVEYDLFAGTGTGTHVELTFTRPGSNWLAADLAGLGSPVFSSSIDVGYASGSQIQSADGPITSIELVSAPEPGTLIVFGLMALAGWAHRRFRR